MKYNLPDVRTAHIAGKTILLRADLDVPLKKRDMFEVGDDTRLIYLLPTIRTLEKHGSHLIICGHLGRPDKKRQVTSKHPIPYEFGDLSLRPVARWLTKAHNDYVEHPQPEKIGMFPAWRIGDHAYLLENLRFFKGEETRDPQFVKEMAALADVYVNDAFAVSHRDHASIAGVSALLPHFAGMRLQKEVEVLSGLLEQPKRPLVVLIGGAKIETKLPLIEKMHHFADYVLVGGKIALETKELLKVQHEKLSPLQNGHKSILLVADTNQEGTDITQKSAENFLQVIRAAKTVVWNGPLGKIGNKKSEDGTKLIAYGIAKTGAYKVAGGGDTTEFLKREGLFNQFDFISSGGGAMLSFLAGEKLPGLAALR